MNPNEPHEPVGTPVAGRNPSLIAPYFAAVRGWLRNDLGDSDWWRLNAPTLMGGTLYVVLIVGLWNEWVPYLSDICNPSTLAETGGPQWQVYSSGHTTVLVFFAAIILLLKPTRNGALLALIAILLALIPVKFPGAVVYHISWTWLAVPMLVFLWRYLLQILFLLNKEEIHRRVRIRALAGNPMLTKAELLEAQEHLSEKGMLKIPLYRIEEIERRWNMPADGPRSASLWGRVKQAGYKLYARTMYLLISRPLRFLEKCSTRQRRFSLLFVTMVILMSAPAWFALIVLHTSHGAWVNESFMALVGLLCLLGLLCLMLSLWQLGALAGVRLYALCLTLLPPAAFILSLFNLSPFEKGQATLNQPEPGWMSLSNTYSKTDEEADANWSRQQQKPFHFLSQQSSPTPEHDSKGAKARKTSTIAAVPKRWEDPKRPIVLFCVSGGGTRAAIFAAGIYARMWQQGPEGKSLLEQVDAISAVSGGSLASAYLCESLSRPDYMNANITDSVAARRQALQKFFDSTDAKKARPAVTWYRESLFGSSAIPPQNLKDKFDKLEADSRLKTFDTNPFINAMRQNFVAPIVSGYFWPLEGRGPSYEDVWERLFHWYDGEWDERKTRRLSNLYPLEQQGKLPVLILNSLLTRTGSRIAFTNLDIDEFAALDKFGPEVNYIGEKQLENDGKHLNADEKQRKPAESERFDPRPSRVLTMNYLAPQWDAPLKKAVRASANFPGALPLMRFRQTGGDGKDENLVWEMQDGGGLENYGVDSLMALLRSNKNEVLKRGVLIFQIDAAYLPVDHNSSRLLLHHAGEVKAALWRAGQNNETTLGSLYLRELEDMFHYNGDLLPTFAERDTSGKISMRALGQEKPADNIKESYCVGYRTDPAILQQAAVSSPGFAYFKVRLGETANDQVLTFWHLDDAERQKLYNGLCSFQQGIAIQEAGKWLAEAVKPLPTTVSATVRSHNRSSAGRHVRPRGDPPDPRQP